MHLLSELITFLSTRPCESSANLDRSHWFLWASSISPKGQMEQSKARRGHRCFWEEDEQSQATSSRSGRYTPCPRTATLCPAPAWGTGSHDAEVSPFAGWLLSSASLSERQVAKSWLLPAQPCWHLALEQVSNPQGGSGGEQKPAP